VIIAEAGADMSRFPTAVPRLVGLALTFHGKETAGRIKSTKTFPDNPDPKGALGVAAMSGISSSLRSRHPLRLPAARRAAMTRLLYADRWGQVRRFR